LYLVRGQADKAASQLELLDKIESISQPVHLLRALIHKSKGERKLAKAILKTLEGVEFELEYAVLLIENGNYMKAFYKLAHILKVDYKNSKAWEAMAQVYSNCGTSLEDMDLPEKLRGREEGMKKAAYCLYKAEKYRRSSKARDLCDLIPQYLI